MSTPVVELTPEEAAAKYKARRDLISILLLISGTVLLSISVGFLFGLLWSLALVGVLLMVVAILIGR
jgi:hypothetical protein